MSNEPLQDQGHILSEDLEQNNQQIIDLQVKFTLDLIFSKLLLILSQNYNSKSKKAILKQKPYMK